MRVSSHVAAARAIIPIIMICASFGLTSCSGSDIDGPLNVAIIGDNDGLRDQGFRLSPGAQHLRSATSQGLVSFNEAGQIVPGIAERWHVSPDGLYYTFRLRDAPSSDEEPISASDVRSQLMAALTALSGTSLGYDLEKLQGIRAMTGRVIELRLSSPMPEFLRLLAQPELGLFAAGDEAGPMLLSRDTKSGVFELTALPPENRGLPAREGWERLSRPLTFQALGADLAITEFSDGNIDLLLNGSIANLPQVELGPLSRGAIQIDPAIGLFGLAFLHSDGVLFDESVREAMSMAIDRAALIEPFGLGGWQGTSFIVPSEVFENLAYPASRWDGKTIEERREVARRRIEAWQASSAGSGNQPLVRVRMTEGPGNDLLFAQLERSWGEIGLKTTKVAEGEPADLEFRDRVARFSSPRWFLNQFNCNVIASLCSEEADALVKLSIDVQDPAEKSRMLAEAHSLLVQKEVFIPFGAPVRWALVRGSVEAFEPNRWNVHPLFPLSQIPN